MKNPIFKANPQAECYFETSDGQKFFKDFDAKNHSKSLESKKIKKVINPDFSTEVAEIEEAKAANSDVVFEEVSADVPNDDDSAAKVEADAKAKTEADAKANAEADAKAKAKAKTEAANKKAADAKVKADATAKKEADATAKKEADAKAKADAKANESNQAK